MVYMGVHREPSADDYRQKGHAKAPTHHLNHYMSQSRWEQIDRCLYCAEVEQSFPSPFGRVWELSEALRERSFRYWTPGKHLCVDEAIARFTGRASEVMITKTKPTPDGFKIWCLVNDGYLMNWFNHARGAGRGPVNLLKSQDPKVATFTPTELVPSLSSLLLTLTVSVWFRRTFTLSGR